MLSCDKCSKPLLHPEDTYEIPVMSNAVKVKVQSNTYTQEDFAHNLHLCDACAKETVTICSEAVRNIYQKEQLKQQGMTDEQIAEMEEEANRRTGEEFEDDILIDGEEVEEKVVPVSRGLRKPVQGGKPPKALN